VSQEVVLTRVDDSNKYLINDFCQSAKSSLDTFRYFNTRTPEAIKNHLVTYVLLSDNNPVGYGHLDLEQDTVWLGVCIIQSYTGKGYGMLMMDSLISFAYNNHIKEINLSVDRTNIVALTMYEKLGFLKTHENEKSYFMKLTLLKKGDQNG